MTLDLDHPYHLGTSEKSKFSGPTTDFMNLKYWDWSLTFCVESLLDDFVKKFDICIPHRG